MQYLTRVIETDPSKLSLQCRDGEDAALSRVRLLTIPDKQFFIYYIMSLQFDVNGKTISHKDLNTVRDFFTDAQWDVIDRALSEYQDHDDYATDCKDTLDVIGQLFRTSYQELITMSSLRNEMILETIYEELMDELTLTETLPMYSEKEIESICYQRFEDMSR